MRAFHQRRTRKTRLRGIMINNKKPHISMRLCQQAGNVTPTQAGRALGCSGSSLTYIGMEIDIMGLAGSTSITVCDVGSDPYASARGSAAQTGLAIDKAAFISTGDDPLSSIAVLYSPVSYSGCLNQAETRTKNIKDLL